MVTNTDSRVSLASLLLDSPAVWPWTVYLAFLYLILPHKVQGIPPAEVQSLAQGSRLVISIFIFLYFMVGRVPPPPLLDLNPDMNQFIPFRLQPVCTGSLTRQLREAEQTRANKFEHKPTRGCGSCDILGF